MGEFWKECEIFSQAHFILCEIVGDDQDPKDIMSFEHDADCTEYPEIYEAWKAQGGGDTCATVVKCPTLGKWAVGLGGKKNAERAAKLSMALALASDADPAKLASVAANYPDF